MPLSGRIIPGEVSRYLMWVSPKVGLIGWGEEKMSFLYRGLTSDRQFQSEECPFLICGGKFLASAGFSLNTNFSPYQMSFHQCAIFIFLSSGGRIMSPLQLLVPHRHSLTLAKTKILKNQHRITAYSIPVQGRIRVSVIVYDLINYVINNLESTPIFRPIYRSLINR